LIKGLEFPKGLAVEAELERPGIPVALAEGCAPPAGWIPVAPRNVPGWLFMPEFIPQELAAGDALGLVGSGRFMPALERPDDCPRHESLD
jgi:hypothetical protein